VGVRFPIEVLSNVVCAKFGPHFGCFLLVAYMIVAVGNPLSDLLCGCGHDLFWVDVCE